MGQGGHESERSEVKCCPARRRVSSAVGEGTAVCEGSRGFSGTTTSSIEGICLRHLPDGGWPKPVPAWALALCAHPFQHPTGPAAISSRCGSMVTCPQSCSTGTSPAGFVPSHCSLRPATCPLWLVSGFWLLSSGSEVHQCQGKSSHTQECVWG